MQVFKGKGLCAGIVMGNVYVYRDNIQHVSKSKVNSVTKEIARYEKAVEFVRQQLHRVHEKAVDEVGEMEASIFEVHQMMLENNSFRNIVLNMIEGQQMNAAYAVDEARKRLVQMFLDMDDEYMRGRAADVNDIAGRLLLALNGPKKQDVPLEEPAILVAEDLSPSDLMRLDRTKLLALVLSKGAFNSHTSILAKIMGIPTVLEIGADRETLELLDKTSAIVDGTEGLFCVAPNEVFTMQMKVRQKEEEERKQQLKALRLQKIVIKNGHTINLSANISGVQDLQTVIENGADGIGLFRTEFLFLGREDYPTEEEQFENYKQVAEAMGNKPVKIRTLDIGADKVCDYIELEMAEHLRGIRFSLARPDIFKTQLRAIFRASVYGNVSVLYPMITTMGEVEEIKKIVADVEEELVKQNIPYKVPKQGVMIETLEAVELSETLAKEVDFFSIGTNDLTKQILNVDRQDAAYEKKAKAHRSEMVDMISKVVDNGHKAGIPVGICGELGSESSVIEEFLSMEVDELSVSPERVLIVRESLLEI